jgi:hypothetical protein
MPAGFFSEGDSRLIRTEGGTPQLTYAEDVLAQSRK